MNFLDDILDIFGTTKDINVLMFGNSGVGKTTTVTAIYNVFADKYETDYNSFFNLFAENDTSDELLNKLAQLKEQIGEKTIKFNPSIPGTSEIKEFKFFLAKNRKSNSRFNINFIDIPGGFLQDRKEQLRELLDKSKIIIISVDSAALMEEYRGTKYFNQSINEPDRIRDYLKEMEKGEDKLVIFTLLKSEKYFRDDSLYALYAKFNEKYANVLSVLKNREDVSIALIPIQTLGSVYFSEIQMVDDNPRFIYKTKFNEKYNPSIADKILFLLLQFIVASEYRKTLPIRMLHKNNLKKAYRKFEENTKNIYFLQNQTKVHIDE